jgi:bis(5'-nucleosyl)-tetraphosphatase (symmetrical)
MGLYLIGDVQGCDSALESLLHTINFSPSKDTLYLLGDLVNRGPASLAVLRRLHKLGDAAQCILGNHDLHALAVAAGARPMGRGDTLSELLASPDAPQLLDWLRQRPMGLHAHGMLMVHAGVLPQWNATQTIAACTQVEKALRQKEYADLLRDMYGNTPVQWRDDLQGMPRLRISINALTRIRFCSTEGEMEFATKDGADAAPAGMIPWFDVPGRKTADVTVAFGHWSTLGLINRPDLIALDTGCVWGGALSALRFDGGRREVVQVQCGQANPLAVKRDGLRPRS